MIACLITIGESELSAPSVSADEETVESGSERGAIVSRERSRQVLCVGALGYTVPL
jgi:hypothetical protein